MNSYHHHNNNNNNNDNDNDMIKSIPCQTKQSRPPPQLIFDDGTRVLQNNEQHHHKNNNKESEQYDEMGQPIRTTTRGRSEQISITDYYEIDHIVSQVHMYQRIALQFPDELLMDAPEVCWQLEERLPSTTLIFCLGDTTYASCCPDIVAAAHLQADCLIHYGHACLSTTTTTTTTTNTTTQSTIPVIYSFGQQPIHVMTCVEQIVQHLDQHQQEENKEDIPSLVIFYDLQYAYAMKELYNQLVSQIGSNIVMAQVAPSMTTTTATATTTTTNTNNTNMKPQEWIIGGLQIPTTLENLSNYVLFYIGIDTSRQYLNIVLRFLSLSSSRPNAFWTFNPLECTISTTLSNTFQRQLNRRFYLLQKAKLCSVFGILVAQLSNPTLQQIVYQIRQLIHDHGRSSYTFAVGKVNPAKLANFAEVECFVLVACPEHSLLDDEREYPVSVITPMELAMALGITDWGSIPYSLDANEFLKTKQSCNCNNNQDNHSEQNNSNDSHEKEDKDDEDDVPHYNITTGQYESVPSSTTTTTFSKRNNDMELSHYPGQGKLIEYHSAAAQFLQQREYQGLQVKAGETVVQVAQKGQQGIASNYGNR